MSPMVDDVQRKDRLAYAIRAAMAKRDLTPPQLAELVGKTPKTVLRWSKGETAPSLLDVAPLARALGVDPRYFIDPPEVPFYPLAEYLVDEELDKAAEEGRNRVRRRQERGDQ